LAPVIRHFPASPRQPIRAAGCPARLRLSQCCSTLRRTVIVRYDKRQYQVAAGAEAITTLWGAPQDFEHSATDSPRVLSLREKQ
jgi:hypothetical protein